MFTTLRARLLASYAFLLVFTLAVIAIILLIVLRSRTAPTDQVSARLATIADGIQNRDDLSSLVAEGYNRRVERILNLLARSARFRGLQIRLLLVRADGTVYFDSLNMYAPGAKLTWRGTPYTPPTLVTEIDGTQPVLTRGSLRSPDGGDWQFVARALNPQSENPWEIVLAIPAPRQLSFKQMLQYYGDDLLVPLLQAGFVGFGVAFGLALVIARSVARPLQEVARAAVAVARGKIDYRAPVRGPREARVVAEAFNQMAEEVARTQHAQREFLANVTHDLRTPLTSIQGFSQAIIDGVASNPEAAQRAARVIYDEAGRLNRMVEELLDLARIEAGRWNMTRQTVQLDDILQAVGERLTPKASDHGLKLSVELMPLPPIAGDGDRLVQVFTNLVDNAIKHTPEGGQVTLRALLSEGGILAQVADTGEGIPAEDLPRIFDRFYQVDKSRQRGPREGAGLGLTITRQIVEAHGGKIWAESAEGVGTTIYVWLPAPASDATTILRRRSGTFRRPAPVGGASSG